MTIRTLIVACLWCCLLALPALAGSRPGVDCDCSLTGSYQPPAKGVAPAYRVTAEDQGESPGKTYRYTVAATGGQVTLTVTTAGDTPVITETFTPVGNASWGFDPVDAAFLLTFLDTSGNQVLRLYRLAGETATRIDLPSYRTGASHLAFARRGRLFFYAAKTGIHKTEILLVDTATGNVYQKTLDLEPAPLDRAGLAGWGFNYFKQDRDHVSYDTAFFYAWRPRGDDTVAWRLVSLPTLIEVAEGNTEPGTWFGFSPCGDLFGRIDGNAGQVALVDTASGAMELYFPGWTGGVQLSSRDDGHYANERRLRPNNAGDQCPAGQDSDDDGVADNDDNCPNHANPDQDPAACQAAEHDTDGDGVADSADNCPLTANPGQEDGDNDGIGDSCDVALHPPVWPGDAQLTASLDDTVVGRVTLQWSPATDDLGLLGYRIYRQGEEEPLAEVGWSRTETTLTGLAPRTTYHFQVAAGDLEGNWTLGPTATVTTTSSDPTWPATAELRLLTRVGDTVQLGWDPAEDDVAVTGYRLISGGATVAETGGDVLAVITTLPTLCDDTFYCVQAGDGDGHWTPGPCLSVAGDVSGPSWPDNSEVTVTDLTATGLTLDWPAANDHCGVAAFRIDIDGVPFRAVPGPEYPRCSGMDGCLVLDPGGTGCDDMGGVVIDEGTVVIGPGPGGPGPAPATSHRLTCLEPGRTYQLAVAAVDPAGNLSPPLTTTVTTPAGEACPASDAVLLSRLLGRGQFFTQVPWNWYWPPCGEWIAHQPRLGSPSLSRDGTVAAFTANLDFDLECQVSHSAENYVYLGYRDRGEAAMMVEHCGYLESLWLEALLSPDGRWVALRRPHALGLYDRINRSFRPLYGNRPFFSFDFQPGLAFSRNATWLAFSVLAPLNDQDTNHDADVYLYNLATGDLRLVSRRDRGLPAAGNCDQPAVASHATFVAMRCQDGAGGTEHIYRVDAAGNAVLVDHTPAGAPGNGPAGEPAISSDGRFIAFASMADDLVAGDTTDTNNDFDVFLADMQQSTVQRISTAAAGLTPAPGVSRHPSLSDTGRYLAFVSDASDLVAGDDNGKADVFVYDRIEGRLARLGGCPCGGGSGGVQAAAISGDGRWLAVITTADDLLPIPADANHAPDIYLVPVRFPQGGTGLAGDVDDDGQLGLADAILSLQAASGVQCTAAVTGDVDGDGAIGTPEALVVLRRLAR